MQQQQKQIEEAVEKAQWDLVLKQAEENGLRLSDFDTILQPIIDSCTKDSISAGRVPPMQCSDSQKCILVFVSGKNWILQHTSDTAKCNSIMQYLLKKYASPTFGGALGSVIMFSFHSLAELWSMVPHSHRSCI